MGIDDELQIFFDQCLFVIVNVMYEGYIVDKIWEFIKIDKWFLCKFKGFSDFVKDMFCFIINDIVKVFGYFFQVKRFGFFDCQFVKFWSFNEIVVCCLCFDVGIVLFVKQIDIVVVEFLVFINYFYFIYNVFEYDVIFEDYGIMVFGFGVYRIGFLVEFDWCFVCVICILRVIGYKIIMVNYNFEIVFIDYDEVDKLYFEVILLEMIFDIYQFEGVSGVLGVMGGQIFNNIVFLFYCVGVKVFGIFLEMIDLVENRFKFFCMFDRIGVDQFIWKELISYEEVQEFCNIVIYFVFVCFLYVFLGVVMNIVYFEKDFENYFVQVVDVFRDYLVVIIKYIENVKEIEMDVVVKDGVVVGYFIFEYVENVGVYFGDVIFILFFQDLEFIIIVCIEEVICKIGVVFNVIGFFNIQFIVKDNDIKVIECNVCVLCFFFFVFKVMGVDLIEMVIKVIMGQFFQEYFFIDFVFNCVGVKVF